MSEFTNVMDTERVNLREMYPCPTCGHATCDGTCDHGDESELHPSDGEPHTLHGVVIDGPFQPQFFGHIAGYDPFQPL